MHDVNDHHTPKLLLAGIIITLLLIMGSVTAMLVPLSILFFRVKIGRKNTFIILAATIVLISVIGKAPNTAIFVYAGWMGLGFLLGECYQLRLSIEKTILIPCLTIFFAGCVLLIFYSNVTQSGIYDLAYNQVAEFMKQLIDARLIEAAPEELIHIATCILPGGIFSTILFMTWLNVIMSRPLFRRSGLTLPDFGPLDRWRAPDQLVWVVIAMTVGLLVPSESINLLSLNMLSISMLVYFFQGVSIVAFFINRTKIPLALRALLYWFVFFQFPFNLLITSVGFFDTWVDFRSRSLKKNEPVE